MNRDDIIRMAREAGFDVEAIEGADEVLERESDYYTRHPDIGYMVQTHTVERFAALVATAEREACAKVCDGFESDADPDAGAVLAAAIRARGNNA